MLNIDKDEMFKFICMDTDGGNHLLVIEAIQIDENLDETGLGVHIRFQRGIK